MTRELATGLSTRPHQLGGCRKRLIRYRVTVGGPPRIRPPAAVLMFYVSPTGEEIPWGASRPRGRAPIAQAAEQLTLNQWVGGSSPSWRTEVPGRRAWDFSFAPRGFRLVRHIHSGMANSRFPVWRIRSARRGKPPTARREAISSCFHSAVGRIRGGDSPYRTAAIPECDR